MARSKQFDTDEVLGKAMRLFWEQGYEHTSMQDLVEGMGVHKRSLYDTFGDKHSLFLKALDRYADTIGEPLIRKSKAEPSAKQAIRGLFEYSLIDDGSRPKGCMIVNSATELALRDPETASRVKRTFSNSEQLLLELVQYGQQSGEIEARHDARRLALTLANAWVGLRVQARVATDHVQLRAIIDGALAMLD
ncbi:TetR/AcrR family transcriptional regulator [Paenibacillus agricola]|uniref:TetR/AcrR family transcriptional regulator n=1 Tax=Paenibacillus agricola TaxID=2716264 RepID=A0ABX0J933_9BACL|nr:TetR/AcrR family transcriptional regulator [Paenibacillus agricola]NHN31915.1 TetR/AcrR family transcriptional regulator [Paenibacillus agricola]